MIPELFLTLPQMRRPLLHDEAELDAVLDALAEILAETVGLDSCVLATAVLCDVLQWSGIPARPWPVCTIAVGGNGNVVLIGKRGRFRDYITDDRSRGKPDAWEGHLAVLTDRFLLDATLGQGSHPEIGVCLGPVVANLSRPLGPNDGLSFAGDNGLRVVYEPDPDNLDWQTSPDWIGPIRPILSHSIMNCVFERLDRKA